MGKIKFVRIDVQKFVFAKQYLYQRYIPNKVRYIYQIRLDIYQIRLALFTLKRL